MKYYRNSKKTECQIVHFLSIFIFVFMSGRAQRSSFVSKTLCPDTNDDECLGTRYLGFLIFRLDSIMESIPVYYRARHNVWRSRSRIFISCSRLLCTNDWNFQVRILMNMSDIYVWIPAGMAVNAGISFSSAPNMRGGTYGH